MEVLLFREAQFHKSLAALRVGGGVGNKAAEEVDRILGRLTAGTAPADAFGKLTKHGETRIPHCVKYDLGNGYRLVCVQDAHAIQVLFVGKHDACDQWLDSHRGHRLVVDKKAPRLSTVHEVKVGDPMPARSWRSVFDPEKPLVDSLDEQHLDLLGASAGDLRRITSLTAISSDDQIQEALLKIADAALRDTLLGALLDLRENRVESAQALIRLHAGTATLAEASPALLKEALASGASSDTVVNLRDLSEIELAHLLGQSSFEDWLLYLHPDQKPVVAADFTGPTLLRGVSGSGKTCVIVHRAKALATRYPDGRIAVLTLNPALAALIDDLITALCPPDVRKRIVVLSVLELCRSIVGCFEPLRVFKEVEASGEETKEDNWTWTFKQKEQLELLAPIITSLASTYDVDAERYLRDEFLWVRSAFGLGDPEARGSVLSGRNFYRDPERTPRRGRELPFLRDWRERVLKALEFYEERSAQRGLTDAAGLALLAHDHLEKLRSTPPPDLTFRAVLVDEYQDLGKVELELVSALAPVTENGFFLAGDPRQQVFPKDHDLAGAGITVAERRYFKKNYRNTREVLEAGVALATQFGVGGQGRDDVEVLDPEYSTRHSAKPLVVAAQSVDSEVNFIARYVELKRTGDDHPICIVACGLREDDEAGLRELLQRFAAEGLKLSLLQPDSRVRAGAVFLSALETVKGFEFSLVLVSQCGASQMPIPSLPEQEAWRDASRLYVAFTRARDELVVTHSGAPSRFLAGIASWLKFSTVEEQGLPATGAALEVAHALAIQKPVSEKPVIQTPVTEEPVAVAKPVSKKPVIQTPVTEEPVAEEPVAVAKPVAEPGLIRDHVAEQPVAEQPVAAVVPVGSRNVELLTELARIKSENAALKKANQPSFKVSEKGAVSAYGLGRFPVTLYKQQWEKVLAMEADIRQFIKDNNSKLASRGPK